MDFGTANQNGDKSINDVAAAGSSDRSPVRNAKFCNDNERKRNMLRNNLNGTVYAEYKKKRLDQPQPLPGVYHTLTVIACRQGLASMDGTQRYALGAATSSEWEAFEISEFDQDVQRPD